MTEDAVETCTHPTHREALARVEAAFDRDAVLALVGRCTVEYDGRTSSSRVPGIRHVMYKPDGTALVHDAGGQKPVNWQPPGCSHAATLQDDRLAVRSVRTTPAEELLVAFESVWQVTAFAAAEPLDPSEAAPAGTEEDLRERVLAEPSLVEPGFRPLATERETAAGAVDIYGEDGEGRTVVVELKRRRVGPDAVGQLSRYVEALDRDLHADAEVRGILVAPSMTDRAQELLARKGFEFVPLAPD